MLDPISGNLDQFSFIKEINSDEIIQNHKRLIILTTATTLLSLH